MVNIYNLSKSSNFKKYIYKQFCYNQTYSGGRNRLGRITVRHRGSKSKSKRKFLMVDLKNSTRNLKWILLQIRPCTRRTAFIGLVLYENGLFSYIVVSKACTIGTIWYPEDLNRFSVVKLGSYINLYKLVEGISIFNVEKTLGCGAIFARSAGTSVKVINRFKNNYNKILIRLRSGDEYLINSNCTAILGVVSNPNHWRIDLRKAGIRRYFGFRSSVRGVAMNPVDHPHGVELREAIPV